MKYCAACIQPSTRPNLIIGDDGICNACKSHKQKPVIDYAARQQVFLKLVEEAKRRSQGYDCLIPVSGGKDSTWQTVKCLEYGLNPLTFTYAPPLRTELGRRNLENLINLGVDHIDYRINPRTEAKFLLKTLIRLGNCGTPMHTAIFSGARSLASKFRIPLIIWGEDSSFEYGGQKDSGRDFELDKAWLQKFGVNHGTTVKDWIDDDLTAKNMAPYVGATDQELSESGTLSIFLGYFFEWDPETTRRVAVEHGMKIKEDGARTGYYNYADLDDEFIAVHHWLKWYKFGFTRLFDNLSIEIRNGRLTRDEALRVLRESGEQRPTDDIRTFCRFVGITEEHFYEIAETFRNKEVWTREGGVWKVRDFIISDWKWA